MIVNRSVSLPCPSDALIVTRCDPARDGAVPLTESRPLEALKLCHQSDGSPLTSTVKALSAVSRSRIVATRRDVTHSSGCTVNPSSTNVTSGS